MSSRSQTEFRLLYTKDSRYRYELRTTNAPSWPASPTHPRLVQDEAPTLHADGTFGDRDFLYTPVPFDRKRIWIHYIPAMSMWRERIHGHHFDQPPIFIKPTESDPRFWRVSPDRSQGKFAPELYNDLRTFWLSGINHAYTLLANARDYAAIPVDPPLVQWQGLLEVGPFSTMIRRLVELQRQLGELYGWIMLQEKLQSHAESIVPNRRGLQSQAGLSPIDQLMGVIVPWDDRSPDFDKMAIEHGMCLWWCDYARPGTLEMPAWHGLSKPGKQEVVTHRGAGFIAVNKEPGTRKFLVEVEDTSHGQGPSGRSSRKRAAAERAAGDSGSRPRPTALSLSDPHPRLLSAPANPEPSTSSGSRTEGPTRPRVADMSPEELRVFREESAARRAAHERDGTAKAPKGKKIKKNREQRRLGRIARGVEPSGGPPK